MIKFVSKLGVDLCRSNPNHFFIFGDNMIGRGKAGQAIIRDEPNSWGIPTKRLPSMKPNAFFSDRQDEYDIVLKELSTLWQMHKDGKCIVLPNNPIGSGLAKVSSKSPKVWSLIKRFYNSAHKANDEV